MKKHNEVPQKSKQENSRTSIENGFERLVSDLYKGRPPRGGFDDKSVMLGIKRNLLKRKKILEFYGLKDLRKNYAEHKTIVKPSQVLFMKNFLNSVHKFDSVFENDFVRLNKNSLTFDEYFALIKNARDFSKQMNELAKQKKVSLTKLVGTNLAFVLSPEQHEQRIQELKKAIGLNFHPDLLIQAEFKGFINKQERIELIVEFLTNGILKRARELRYSDEYVEQIPKMFLKHILNGELSFFQLSYLSSLIPWRKTTNEHAKRAIEKPVFYGQTAGISTKNLYYYLSSKSK